MNTDYEKTLTSFSGADLLVAFGNKVIGELQQISWAIERRKAPIFTFGSADARSFSRGVRGIAGSLVFVVFNRDALVEEIKEIWEDVAPEAMFTARGNIYKLNKDGFADAVRASGWGGAEDTLQEVRTMEQWNDMSSENFDGANADAPAGFAKMEKENILYADTLPPFDVTMTFANEYGQTAFQKIYDVDILNETSGVSVDSTMISRELTFIARRVSPIMKGAYNRG